MNVMNSDKIGIVDTMFSRINMGNIALRTLEKKKDYGDRFIAIRRTVPGFKDLAVVAKKMIEVEKCKIIIAMAMPGKAELDRFCAHEASLGIMAAQLLTNTSILEVFVHEVEGDGNPDKLFDICEDRCIKHALNAYDMVYNPESLIERAGQGVRQGSVDVGPLLRNKMEL